MSLLDTVTEILNDLSITVVDSHIKTIDKYEGDTYVGEVTLNILQLDNDDEIIIDQNNLWCTIQTVAPSKNDSAKVTVTITDCDTLDDEYLMYLLNMIL